LNDVFLGSLFNTKIKVEKVRERKTKATFEKERGINIIHTYDWINIIHTYYFID
jgi:hypothetical protein